jgi:hypothetical protein
MEGPFWTYYDAKTVAGEDHLGIKYVAINIADILQNGISSITPRARYWSFFAWVLYDFIEHEEDKSRSAFLKFLKVKEWHYILANIGDAEDEGSGIGIMGSTKGELVWDKGEEMIDYHDDYLRNPAGGYATYANVMKLLGLTKGSDQELGVEIDRLTEWGKKTAEAFKDTIANTQYYREYRNQKAVPRRVLKTYGRIAGLNRLKMNNSKDFFYLKESFLPDEPKNEIAGYRKQSLEYYSYLMKMDEELKMGSFMKWQDIMFDHYSPWGDKKDEIPKEYLTVAYGWSIYHCRQIFTYSLESIWTYLLDQMHRKVYSEMELFNDVVEEIKRKEIDVEGQLKTLIEGKLIEQADRREMICDMTVKDNVITRVYQPLLLIFDVLNKLKHAKGLDKIHEEFIHFGAKDHISLYEFQSFLMAERNSSIKEFLHILFHRYVIRQHQNTALHKLITTGNETYRFIKENGVLQPISSDRPAFNVFRVNQGISILEDLGMK